MRRAALGVLAVVVLVPVAAVAGADAVLQTGWARGRLAQVVERATGHATNLGEGAGVSVSGLWRGWPAVEVRDLVLLNRTGFSRPAFATVARASAAVSLWPLLSGRVDVAGVQVDGVDVLLERDAAGTGNWEREARAPEVAAPSPAVARGAPWRVELGEVEARNVVVALKAPAVSVSVPLMVAAPSGGTMTGSVLLNGVPLTVVGNVDTSGGGTVTLNGTGMQVRVAGRMGAEVTMTGQVEDLSALSPLAGRALPALRRVTFEGRMAPGGAGSFTAKVGMSELGHGVRVAHAEVSAPALDQPVRLTGEGSVGALPVSVAVNVLRGAALFAGDAVPFQALVLADGGTVSLAGTVPRAGGVPEMTVAARIPDLRRAGMLAGVGLPGMTDLTVEGRTAAAPGEPGLLVRGLRGAAAQGDVGGDLLVRWAPRPLVRGSLVSQRLDLDAMLAPTPAVPQAAGPGAGAAPAPATAAPQRPLPFAALRAGDADLRLAAGAITWRGGQYRALQARVLLQDGRLRIDPAQVVTPGGSVEARVVADAVAVPPTLGVTMLAPGMDAAAWAAMAGVPGAATGTVDLDVDLRGVGAELGAMGATLDGHAGVALVNGDVENQVLLALFGGALRAANLPTDAAGRSRVRCFATRLDAVAGHVDVRTLALDASRARLDGEGSVNLVDQTVDLHLRPVLRLGSTGVAVPVHLAGPLRAPKPELERGAISPGRVGLSILGGGGAQPDLCGPALAAARGNRPGMAPGATQQ